MYLSAGPPSTLLAVRSAFCFGFIVLLSVALRAQSGPDLSVSGFRAGMSPQEVRLRIEPGYIEIPVEFEGTTGFAERKGEGMTDIYFFTFFAGKLISVSHHREFAAGKELDPSKVKRSALVMYGEPVSGRYSDHPLQVKWRYESGLRAARSEASAATGPHDCWFDYQVPDLVEFKQS